MKKKIFVIVAIFYLLFFIIVYNSLKNYKKINFWQLKNNLSQVKSFIAIREKDINLNSLISSNLLDSIYIINEDRFIGKIDLVSKNNINKIRSDKNIRKDNSIYEYVKFKNKELIIKKSLNINEYTTLFHKNLLLFYGIILLISMIFFFITYFMVLKPLNNFVSYTEQISEGNFNKKINLEGSSEIKKLTKSFNKMLSKINRDMKLLKYIINNMKLGFIISNKKGKVYIANNEAKRIFSNNLKEYTIYQLFPFLKQIDNKEDRLYASKKIEKLNGEPIYADLIYSNFHWQKKDDKVLIFKEIKDYFSYKNEKLTKILDNISSMIAHELKNPLNVVSMILQILEKKYDEEEMWNDLNFEIDKIENIINNFSEFLKFKESIIEIDDFINNISQKWKKILDKKGIYLEADLNSRAKIIFDIEKLKIIFTNLLKNCYENSKNIDKIKLNTAISNNKLVITIIEFGEGINKDKLLQITDKGVSNKSKNRGWGLFIVKEFLKYKGGDLQIKTVNNSYTKIIMEFDVYENTNS